jgi:CO/xanthine dehydrogenase FAD-binding subunit
VTAIRVPRRLAEGRASFLKLGSRRFLVISIVSAAVLLLPDAQGHVAAARIAVGACSAVPLRLPTLEQALQGRPLAADLANLATAAHIAPLSPIDDVRGGAQYRRDAAVPLLRDAILAAVEGRAGGMA